MWWDEDIILFITTTHICLLFGRTEKAKTYDYDTKETSQDLW